jgi:hypothetical protein
VHTGRLHGSDRIGVKVGTIIDKYKMAKHFDLQITNTTLAVTRKQAQIDTEAALDGIYVIRTSVPATDLDPASAVTAYKNLARVERDFRSMKADDLDLRPVRHWTEDRVRAHVLICLLAGYLTWHLRKTWAPLTYTDEHPTTARQNPVAPAKRSTAADRKAARHRDHNDQPVRSFRGLLDHLATLTRNQIKLPGTPTTFDQLTTATETQRRAFELLNTPIPTTLK